MKGDLQEVLQKYEIDETDIICLGDFIRQFNRDICCLKRSVFYSERCLQNLLMQEKIPGNLRKIELVKGSINSMKEKQLEWQDDLNLLTKVYRKEIKKCPVETYTKTNQMSMF